MSVGGPFAPEIPSKRPANKACKTTVSAVALATQDGSGRRHIQLPAPLKASEHLHHSRNRRSEHWIRPKLRRVVVESSEASRRCQRHGHQRGPDGSTGNVFGIDPSPEIIARAGSKARKARAEVSFKIAVAETCRSRTRVRRGLEHADAAPPAAASAPAFRGQVARALTRRPRPRRGFRAGPALRKYPRALSSARSCRAAGYQSTARWRAVALCC